MGAAFGARRQQKRKIQGSRFPLGTLLGSILKAHDGLEGFPTSFGRGLKRALLKKLIFERCPQRNHYFYRLMGARKPARNHAQRML